MALDDFSSEEKIERRQELTVEPPEDAESWIEAEPGTPDWMGFIESTEVEEGDDEVLEIKITGVDATAIKCANPYSLDRMR